MKENKMKIIIEMKKLKINKWDKKRGRHVTRVDERSKNGKDEKWLCRKEKEGS